MGLLEGKLGIVFGVANKRSIAWAIAQAWHREGATLAFTYQGERLKDNVEELAGTFGADTLILPCDVSSDDQIRSVFTAVKEKFGRLDLLLHAWPSLRKRPSKAISSTPAARPSGCPTTSAPIRSSLWPARRPRSWIKADPSWP